MPNDRHWMPPETDPAQAGNLVWQELRTKYREVLDRNDVLEAEVTRKDNLNSVLSLENIRLKRMQIEADEEAIELRTHMMALANGCLLGLKAGKAAREKRGVEYYAPGSEVPASVKPVREINPPAEDAMHGELEGLVRRIAESRPHPSST